MKWYEVLAALVVSFAISWFAVGASIKVAVRWKVFDAPDGGRKTQEKPIPRLGGVAIAVTFVILVLAGLLVTGRLGFALALGVVLPALLASCIGLLDDRRHLNPYLRLLLQASVGILAWSLGSRIGLTELVLVNLILTVLWVMVLINGVNLLDNSDGLAASSVLTMAVGASIIAALYGQALVVLFGAAVAGVCLGYLLHNWYPARVYMGDSGSYFLGTLIALLLLRLTPGNVPTWVGALVVLFLALLPLADTSFVVVRRLRAGIHPFTAGRDHLSHEIQARGRTVPASVALLQVVSVAGTLIAVLLVLPWA